MKMKNNPDVDDRSFIVHGAQKKPLKQIHNICPVLH